MLFLQVWQKRSHKTRYQVIGENSITKTVKTLGKETTVPIKTQLLLTVSNYHFNVEAAKSKKDFTCTPSDCKISLKFSSEDFIPKNASEIDSRAYHFDKAAFCVSYSSFMSFLADQELKEHVWPEILTNYREATGIDLQSHDDVQDIYLEAAIDLPRDEEVDGHKKGGGRIKSSYKRTSKRGRHEESDDVVEEERPGTPMPNHSGASDEEFSDSRKRKHP